MRSEHVLINSLGVLSVCVGYISAYTITQLSVPDLDAYVQAIQKGLEGRYANVSVEVVNKDDVPDLKSFGWVTKGLGTPTLLDVGSGEYLLTVSCHNSTYNMTSIAQTVPELTNYYNNDGAYYGSSALYAPLVNSNGEAVNNYRFGVGSSSVGAIVNKDTNELEVVQLTDDMIGPFGSMWFTGMFKEREIKIKIK